MGIAAQVAYLGRQWPGFQIAGPPMGASAAGGAFLPDVFGATARQLVEMAFGADLTASSDTWPWTDTTSFFLWDPGVVIENIGRPEESLRIVPASFTGTIRNDQPNGGDFTIGNTLGKFWPNIRENTPVRARLDVGNGATVRFFGYASQWRPTWDADRELAVVEFKANGIARRLLQGTSASQSPLWRFHMLAYRFDTSTNLGWPDGDQQYHALPTHYWSLEEGQGALEAANAVAPGYPLRAFTPEQVPEFGSDSGLVCSKPGAAFIDGSTLTASFPLVTPGGYIESYEVDTTSQGIRVQFLVRLPTGTIAGLKNVLGTLVDGTTAEILRIAVNSTGMQYLTYFLDSDPTNGISGFARLYDSGGGIIQTLGGDIGYQWERGVYVTLDLIQTGANVEIRMGHIPLTAEPATGQVIAGELVTLYFLHTIANATLRGIYSGSIGLTKNLGGAVVSHLSVYNGPSLSFPDRYPHALLGRIRDRVDTRLRRLGIEQNVPIEIVGEADIAMGVQGIGGFLDLVTEGETVDGGVLLDGLHAGLTYVARTQAYSATASLALDAGNGDIIGPLVPRQDDQGRVNTFTARNPAGGEATFTRTDGDLGTGTIGVYDSSDDFPVAVNATLYDEAAWRVHQGTIGGLRYPKLPFELAKPGTSTKAQRWLDSLPLGRLDVQAIDPGAVEPDKSYLLRGWSERWNSKQWRATANVSPYAARAVGTLAADTGDNGEFVIDLDTDGSTLVTGVDAGATSLSVATNSGPIWVHPALSTYADDIVGLEILIDGLRIAVTAIANSSSPQTFTVDPATVLKPLPAGASVSVWQPPVLGL